MTSTEYIGTQKLVFGQIMDMKRFISSVHAMKSRKDFGDVLPGGELHGPRVFQSEADPVNWCHQRELLSPTYKST
jgi:hypothetical protein